MKLEFLEKILGKFSLSPALCAIREGSYFWIFVGLAQGVLFLGGLNLGGGPIFAGF